MVIKCRFEKSSISSIILYYYYCYFQSLLKILEYGFDQIQFC